MPQPLAYFITWSTYGTWLHGDERGSVARAGENYPNTPMIPPSPAREDFESAELKHPGVVLDEVAREIVRATITDHAAIRAWGIRALNVRSNHVHVVVGCPCSPEKAMGEFKAWCTRRLRETGVVCKDARVWTRHGSTKHLFEPESLQRAIRYVMDGQGPDLPERSE